MKICHIMYIFLKFKCHKWKNNHQNVKYAWGLLDWDIFFLSPVRWILGNGMLDLSVHILAFFSGTD